MEISGKVISVLPLQTGEGKKGTWRKQEYVLETSGQYPKKICFSVWGEKINTLGISAGNNVTVSIELESREYNGRWFTEVRAWKGSVNDSRDYSPPPDTIESSKTDDLPF